MANKEALKRIETMFPFNKEYKSNYYTQFSNSIEPFYKDFNLISQDLDRLEKLEKTIATLKDILIVEDFTRKDGSHEYYMCRRNVFPVYTISLTKEQYEVLKDVLGYEC